MQKQSTAKALQANWQVILLVGGLATLLLFFAGLLFVRARTLMEDQVRERLKSTVTAASMQFDGEDLEDIRTPADMARPVFKETVDRLKRLTQEIPDIQYAYLMRLTDDDHILEFIADADVLSQANPDDNQNGILDPNEEHSYPGDLYDISEFPQMREAFLHSVVDQQFTRDQWGLFISAYAPVRRHDDGRIVAIVGMDMEARDYAIVAQSILSPTAFIFLLIATGTLGGYVVFFILQNRTEAWKKVEEERAGLMLLTYHQLGSPLTIFKWSLENLKERDADTTLEAAVAENLPNMEEGLIRMDRMLRILKEAAELQEGHVMPLIKQHNLSEIVQASVAPFHAEMERTQKTVDIDIPKELTLQTDGNILSSIFRHLLTNAMDFSAAGAHVTVSVKQLRNEVQIDVSDTGHGIPKQDISRLFSKFVRGSNAVMYQPDGNGLGLFIVKGFVEKLGGQIWVKSTLGQGTTFSFTLPMKKGV